MRIQQDVIAAIGSTPLIRLRKASEVTGCTILGKAEFMNPGGSVKDRAALAIVKDALAKGQLKPGGVIVEGTAGNTGIGLALVANAMGFRTVIVIPETQSQEETIGDNTATITPVNAAQRTRCTPLNNARKEISAAIAPIRFSTSTFSRLCQLLSGIEKIQLCSRNNTARRNKYRARFKAASTRCNGGRCWRRFMPRPYVTPVSRRKIAAASPPKNCEKMYAAP